MISIETWLESFGFSRNPFETTEAGSEAYYATDFLHETFVKPYGFDEILGHPSHPKSGIVFASRGKGKTSARLMTAHFCREGLFAKEIGSRKDVIQRVLPVHHTRFEGLLESSNSQSELVNAHVVEILLRAVSALAEMIIKYPDLVERVSAMGILRRLELQYFFVAYQGYVPLQELNSARDLLGREIDNLYESRNSIGFSLPGNVQQKINLPAQEIESHLKVYSEASVIDQLGRFAALLLDVGIKATYILVDGLDEIPETADNFVNAAGLLIPLLANLNLMTNTPHLAFKVFVPAEMEQLLLETTQKVRRDRVAVQKIELQQNDLVEILHRRLAYSSNGVVSSLDAISSLDMRGKIEKDLALYAAGNPRALVLLGQYMLEHRCRIVGPDDNQDLFLLNDDDLMWATQCLGVKTAGENAPSISSKKTAEIQQELSTEEVEVYQPTDWFRHELPAPIAFAYLVYQRESVAHVRIWKMYELVEASLAFLSQVLLAILYQNLQDKTSVQLKKSGLRFERTSMGIWRIALEKLPGMLAGLGIRNSFARACQGVLEKNREFIQEINDERNRSAHGGPQSEAACDDLLNQFTDPLQQYLMGLSFLRKSYLIKVLSIHKENNKYLHRCTSFIGDAPIFSTVNIELVTPLDSEYLWLLSGDLYVKLHPLLFVTSGEKLGEIIWLYQGMDKEEVLYKSYGMGKTLSNSDYRSELTDILGIQ